MNWRVLVHTKPAFADHRGRGLAHEWRRAKLKGLKTIRTGQAYELLGDLDQAEAQRLADRLLTDPVTQAASVFPSDRVAPAPGSRLAEVWPKKGVADPVAGTVAYAAQDLGVAGLSAVRSGQVYDFFGAVSPADVKRFCEEHWMNAMIQSVEVL